MLTFVSQVSLKSNRKGVPVLLCIRIQSTLLLIENHFLFSSSCLQSWLEQDTSCPTCRLGLSVQNAASIHPDIERIIDEQENATRANNHFFHFNGKLLRKFRYISDNLNNCVFLLFFVTLKVHVMFRGCQISPLK